MLKSINDIYTLAQNKAAKTLVLVAAQDPHALGAVVKAVEMKLIKAILVGDEKKIKQLADEQHLSIDEMPLIHEADEAAAAVIAVKMVRNREADIVMKGKLPTAALAHAILNREYGLGTGRRLSHLALFELAHYHKLLGLTDGGINISPTLHHKKDILVNAVEFLHKTGLPQPKVAVLTAIETVNEHMQATLDAAALKQMQLDGEIQGCLVEGPISFDIAISAASAAHKQAGGVVGGDADILLTHVIEVANALYKSFTYMAGGQCATVMLGASAPIVLTSRSDSEIVKLNSIVLASAVDL